MQASPGYPRDFFNRLLALPLRRCTQMIDLFGHLIGQFILEGLFFVTGKLLVYMFSLGTLRTDLQVRFKDILKRRRHRQETDDSSSEDHGKYLIVVHGRRYLDADVVMIVGAVFWIVVLGIILWVVV